MKRRCLGSRRAALLSLWLLLGSLLVGACRVATDPVDPGAGDMPIAPPIAVERAARSGAGAEDIVYDAGQMAGLPCHSMAFTIMGRCTEDEVQLLAAEIRRRAEAGAPIGIIEARKLADKGATPEDRQPTAEDAATPSTEGDASSAEGGPASGAGAGLVAGRDLGDGIVYDAEAMAEFACHAMGETIMGRCSDNDLLRMKAELLDKRRQAAGRPTPLPDILPGGSSARTMTGAMGTVRAGASGPEALAQPGRPLTLGDGARTTLRAQLARWKIDGVALPAYAYNGQIPGPQLRVRQGSTVEVAFENAIDMDTTIHWHGLRHANGSDGVPGVTQAAVAPGGRFTYHLSFPDPGLYWYHPHIREDIQQDGGLYGSILVTPARADYWAPADRESVLVLDDIRVEKGAAVGYGAVAANFAIMGRFGNTLLINGQTGYQQVVDAGSVVRFYLVNVANVRPFRLSFDGARMKQVGADLGRSAVEAWVDEVLLAPAERVIVEVAFDEARTYHIQHRSADQTYTLGEVLALAQPKGPSVARLAWDRLRVDMAMGSDLKRLKAYADLPPDMDLELTVDIPDLVVGKRTADGGAGGGGADAEAAAHGPIEWEDGMLAVNRASSAAGVHWMIRDRASGAMNHDLAYTFRVGDIVRVRLHNLGDSVHPMQHPIHFHGQRLMVLSRNGEAEHHPVWKDTVLTTPGETVELLMEITNPGAWMVHCHIAEHLESGMMFQFQVLPADETTT